MLNQNAIENDAYKIDIMKEEDVLNNDFNINFKAFQMKYDVIKIYNL